MRDPHDICREVFGDDVDAVAGRLFAALRCRQLVGRVAAQVQRDPSFRLGLDYGILAALAELEEKGLIR